MNQFLKYGLIVIAVLIFGLTITYAVFISTFDLFGEPEKTILEMKCDSEGLRQATTYNFGGNAVTIPLIAVSIDLGCSAELDNNEKKVIFSAEHKGGTNVKTNWKSFDTLEIVYTDKLEPITKIEKLTFDEATLNVTIEYRKE